MPTYAEATRITGSELRRFDDIARTLLDEYHAAGWHSYLSNRGHAYLLAPDGSTTESISPDLRHDRSKKARRDLERWLATNARHASSAPRTEVEAPVTMTLDRPAIVADAQPEPAAHTCPDCGRIFEKVAALRAHAIHHQPRPCPECGADFTGRSRALAAHRLHEHGVEMPGVVRARRRANPVCEWCGRSFATVHALGSHTKVHKGEPKPAQPPVVVEPEPKPAPKRGKLQPAVVEAALAAEARASVALDGETISLGPASVVEPAPLSTHDAVEALVTTHVLSLPEGDDAEQIVASIRAIVAAPLITKLRELARENDELRAANQVLVAASKDAEARFDLLREALNA